MVQAEEDYVGNPIRLNIRGIDKGTLILLNGVPINLEAQNSMITAIPVEAVERVEIVKGASSVLYGAEAMGGVINVITKQTNKPSTSVGGEFGNVESNTFINTGGPNWNLRYKKEWIKGLYPFNSVVKQSKGYSVSNKHKSHKDGVFFNMKLGDKLTANYIFNDIDSGFTAWGFPNMNDIYKDRTMSTNYIQNRRQHVADIIYDDKENEFRAIASYLHNELKYWKTAKSKKTGEWETTLTDSIGQGYSVDIQKGWKLGETSHLLSGMTWHKEKYDRDPKHIERNSYATFLSYEKEINKFLSAIIGARAHFVKANHLEKKQNVFLPQFQMNYKMNPQTSLYLNVGKGFEMPSITSPFSYKLSEDLKPQEGWNYETGVKHITEKEGWKLALFHMDITNKFDWVKENQLIPGGNPDTNVIVNKAKFRNTGIEWEYSRKLSDNWNFKYSISYANPQSKSLNGKWEQDFSKFQTGLDLTYQKDRLSANMNCFFIGAREDAAYTNTRESSSKKGADHSVPDSFQVNASLRYKATPRDTFTFGVYNLLDRENLINRYEYPALRRNVRVGYIHTF